MAMIRSLAFAYSSRQDRVLALANQDGDDARSFWLTRRMVMALLERAPSALESGTGAAARAPAEFRHDFVAFEQEAALLATASAIRRAPARVMQRFAGVAELAVLIRCLSKDGAHCLEFHGEHGGLAMAALGKAELLRVLQMLRSEVRRAGWEAGSGEQSGSGDPVARTARH